MESWEAKREAIRVSKYLDEINQAISNDKDLSDLASIMCGLGLHTYWLGLELEKNQELCEIGKKLSTMGKHWHKHSQNLQAIALSRLNSHAAD